MDVIQRNEALIRGDLERPGVFPQLELLQSAPVVFPTTFGLDRLPDEPGVIVIRGPRQYGKSTWLEARLKESVEENGPGSAFYLNGDEIQDAASLAAAIRETVALFREDRACHRLFIDEITAIKDWQSGLKRVLDAGELRSVLVVTTGSKAADLRRGSERLPGRRGRLERSNYLFTPVRFVDFRKACSQEPGEKTLLAYLLTGGCPVACGEMVARGRLPEYVPTMIRDWIYGECSSTGRPRSSLLAVMESLVRFGGTPIGQAKLAREAGLANNTVAAGYVELLADLMCLGLSPSFDASRGVCQARKPAKYPMINLLAAVSWDKANLRSVADFEALPATDQGRWYEWLVAQELWRRAAIAGEEFPEILPHWRSGQNEVDFVIRPDLFLEVKRGHSTAMEYAWFPKAFPRARLVVVCKDSFRTRQVRGMTFEEFLSEGEL
jgi:uncharacterized protein